MLDEHFASGSSSLHERDVRVKLCLCILSLGAIAATKSHFVASMALLYGGLLVLLSGLPLTKLLKRVALVNSFTIFLWLILPFTYIQPEANPTILFGSIPVYQEGVELAFLITLKTNAAILLIIALCSTSNIASIGYGLQSLKMPDRLTFLLLFSYRNIIVMYKEYTKLLQAAQIRNFSPSTNLHTYKTYAHLFAMTLIKSWNRGERVHEAMVMRGFDGKLHTLVQPTLTRKDYLFLLCNLIPIVALVVLNFI